jgi:hypothetical protein
MIRIKDWNGTFENADTRKRQRLGWFHCPSGNDSQGYVELMSYGERGIQAYAVFIAICQWSATCLPVIRGSCARSDGRPMNIRQIAATIRMPPEVVEDAIALLSSQDVGWLLVENMQEIQGNKQICQSSADHLPVACQSSASCLPQGKGKGQGEGQGEGEGEGQGKDISSVVSEDRKPEPVYSDSPVFPCDGDVKTWQPTQRQVEAWQQAYPQVDVAAELRKAAAWVTSNRRKTAKGMPRFVNGWLARTTDKSTGPPRATTTYQTTADRTKNVFASIREMTNADDSGQGARIGVSDVQPRSDG